MATGRGKKKKKPQWQLVLGVKQVLCGALGLTWMMVIIFILGVLAGRGDIYRWLSSWGIITPGPANIALWSPPPPPPAKAVPPVPGAKHPVKTAKTSRGTPKPVRGSIAPTPHRVATHRVKKAKKGFSHRAYKEQKAALQKLRREVAKKLTFQNTIGRETSRRGHKTRPRKGKAANHRQETSRRVRVAHFRSLKAAKARMRVLQKKGKRVTLRKGKDKKGVVYEIYREVPVKHARKAPGLAHQGKKSHRGRTKRRAVAHH